MLRRARAVAALAVAVLANGRSPHGLSAHGSGDCDRRECGAALRNDRKMTAKVESSSTSRDRTAARLTPGYVFFQLIFHIFIAFGGDESHFVFRAFARSIPACAGEPRCASGSRNAPADYPRPRGGTGLDWRELDSLARLSRPRGGTGLDWRELDSLAGLSPPSRGNRRECAAYPVR